MFYIIRAIKYSWILLLVPALAALYAYLYENTEIFPKGSEEEDKWFEESITTIVAAATASSDERQRRMRAMRQHLVEHDVQRWAREFLERLNAPDNQTRPENSMNGSKADFTHRGRSNNDR